MLQRSPKQQASADYSNIAAIFVEKSPSAKKLIEDTATSMASTLLSKSVTDEHINQEELRSQHKEKFSVWLRQFFSLISTQREKREEKINEEFEQLGISAEDVDEFKSIYNTCRIHFEKQLNVFRPFYELADSETIFCAYIVQLAQVLAANNEVILKNINQYFSEKYFFEILKNRFDQHAKTLKKSLGVGTNQLDKSITHDPEQLLLKKLAENDWKLNQNDLDAFIRICHTIASTIVLFRIKLNEFANEFDYRLIEFYVKELNTAAAELGYSKIVQNIELYNVYYNIFLLNFPTNELTSNTINLQGSEQSHIILQRNLIMPVQRLPKISLLLNELNKTLNFKEEGKNSAQENLDSLQRKFSRVNHEINESLRELGKDPDQLSHSVETALFYSMLQPVAQRQSQPQANQSGGILSALRQEQEKIRDEKEKEKEQEKEQHAVPQTRPWSPAVKPSAKPTPKAAAPTDHSGPITQQINQKNRGGKFKPAPRPSSQSGPFSSLHLNQLAAAMKGKSEPQASATTNIPPKAESSNKPTNTTNSLATMFRSANPYAGIQEELAKKLSDGKHKDNSNKK